jgi:glycosyltransferase involved in cell wall biosynthesis
MLALDVPRVGYVLKRYPRYSETFIVNEILAHERAGLHVEIFSLYPPNDDHFQDAISHVRAPVTYLTPYGLKAADLWTAIKQASDTMPSIYGALEMARDEEVRDVYQALLLARAVKQRRIVHLHAHFGNVAATVARLATQFAGIEYTFTAHAKDIFHESVRPEELAHKMRDASTVVTVSDYNLDYLRETFGPAAEHTVRIFNGLDLQNFPFTAPCERPPTIVAVGRLVEKKGFADLIDACAILATRGVAFKCEIIGTGELEADLEAQIDRLGMRERVELLGPRPQSDVCKHVGGAALFAAPCVVGSDGNRDGLPTVLLEAMALGTPCISTDVTGIPEVLTNEVTGLMVPQHDPATLAGAIERLLSDAKLRVSLARNARALIEEEFSADRNAARLRELFGVEANAGHANHPVLEMLVEARR